MGLRVPPCRVWCGAFVHQAFRQAGVQLSARLIDPHRSFYDARRRPQRPAQHPDQRRSSAATSSSTTSATDMKASHLAIARGRPSGKHARHGRGQHEPRRAPRDAAACSYIVLAARVTGDA